MTESESDRGGSEASSPEASGSGAAASKAGDPSGGTGQNAIRETSCLPRLKRLLIERYTDSNSIRYRPTFTCHVLISAAILLGSGLLYFAAAKIIDHKARQWKVCLGAIEAEGFTPKSINDSINRLGTSAAAGTAVAASTTTQSGAAPQLQPRPPAQAGVQTGLKPVTLEQKKRLTEQVKSIERGLQTSCQAGIFYFTSRNATLTVSTAAGILTIASLGFISKQGWDKTNNALINVGITSGLILFTLWTYGQLYSQSKNVENLTTKYITACNLLNTIATSLANSRDQPAELPQLDLNTEEGMARFMRAIDSKLEIIEKPEFLLDDSFAKQSAERFNRLLTTEPPPARPAP